MESRRLFLWGVLTLSALALGFFALEFARHEWKEVICAKIGFGHFGEELSIIR